MTQSELTLGAERASETSSNPDSLPPASLDATARDELRILDVQRRYRGDTLRQLLVLMIISAAFLAAVAIVQAGQPPIANGAILGLTPLAVVLLGASWLQGLLFLVTGVTWLRWSSAGHKEIAMLAGREVPHSHSLFLDFVMPIACFVRPLRRQMRSMDALEALGVRPARRLAALWWGTYLLVGVVRVAGGGATHIGVSYAMVASSVVLIGSAMVARVFIQQHDRATDAAFDLAR